MAWRYFGYFFFCSLTAFGQASEEVIPNLPPPQGNELFLSNMILSKPSAQLDFGLRPLWEIPSVNFTLMNQSIKIDSLFSPTPESMASSEASLIAAQYFKKYGYESTKPAPEFDAAISKWRAMNVRPDVLVESWLYTKMLMQASSVIDDIKKYPNPTWGEVIQKGITKIFTNEDRLKEFIAFMATKPLLEDYYRLEWTLGWDSSHEESARLKPAVLSALQRVKDNYPEQVDMDLIVKQGEEVRKLAETKQNEWTTYRHNNTWDKRAYKSMAGFLETLNAITVGSVMRVGGGLRSQFQGKGYAAGTHVGADYILALREDMKTRFGETAYGTDAEFETFAPLEFYARSLSFVYPGQFLEGLVSAPREEFHNWQREKTGLSDLAYERDRLVRNDLYYWDTAFTVSEVTVGLVLMANATNATNWIAKAKMASRGFGYASGLTTAQAASEEIYLSTKSGEVFDVERVFERSVQNTAGTMLFMGGMAKLAKSATAATGSYRRGASLAMGFDILEASSSVPALARLYQESETRGQLIALALLATVTIFDGFDVRASGALSHYRGRDSYTPKQMDTIESVRPQVSSNGATTPQSPLREIVRTFNDAKIKKPQRRAVLVEFGLASPKTKSK